MWRPAQILKCWPLQVGIADRCLLKDTKADNKGLREGQQLGKRIGLVALTTASQGLYSVQLMLKEFS